MAQQNLDLYYPQVLDAQGRLIPQKVNASLRRAFDYLYKVAPPPGSLTDSSLLLDDDNIGSVSASKLTSGTVAAGVEITLSGITVATPSPAKLKWATTGQMYVSDATNVLFIVPQTDQTNFLHLGSSATGNILRWRGIDLKTLGNTNTVITLQAMDNSSGDSGYVLASSTGGTNHTWRVDGGDAMGLDDVALFPSGTRSLGKVGAEWNTLRLTNPLGIAYGGTALASTPTNGQLLIGNGTNYTLAALTAGSGITVTNGAGSITVATALTLAAGTYTPTFTNVANLDASTASQAQYLRVGNTVTVSGVLEVDPTAATTTTQLGISLPVASNFGGSEDCGGCAAANSILEAGAIYADAANDRAQLDFISQATSNHAMAFTFTYQVI